MNRLKDFVSSIKAAGRGEGMTQEDRDAAIAASMAAQNSAGMVLLLSGTEATPVTDQPEQPK